MTYDHVDKRGLRASDAERSATADLLRKHHAEGRLDTTELEERLERCYAAKTRGELDAVTADLPGARPRRYERRRPRGVPFPFPVVPIALLVVLAVTTHAHVLWLVFPLVLALFSLGCGLLVEHASGLEVPRALLLPLGLALLIVEADLVTMREATAQLAAPLAIATKATAEPLGAKRLAAAKVAIQVHIA